MYIYSFIYIHEYLNGFIQYRLTLIDLVILVKLFCESITIGFIWSCDDDGLNELNAWYQNL